MIEVGKVAMIQISSIILLERARKDLGDLDSMETNMKESGHITPLTVKDNFDGTYTLLAGERRYTILLRHNGPESLVAARIYDRELSELEMKVIEQSENLFRKDMEYFEYDDLVRQIHNLQQEIHGEKLPGPSSEGWGTKETAEAVGLTQGMISPALKRAEMRERFPQLFENCKSALDATKVIKKLNEEVLLQDIVKNMNLERSNDSLATISKSFIIKSFFEGVKDIPNECIHLCEVDPPYAIDYMKRKSVDGESKYDLANYNEIDPTEYIEGSKDPSNQWLGIRKCLQECHRVMSTHSWLIFWFSMQPWFELVHKEIRDAGFKTSRHCGIWAKNSPGQNFKPNTRLSTSYDTFFYASKGEPALNKPGRANAFHFSRMPQSQQTHPAEHPLELMKELYETFAFPGSRVLIPFLGSGVGLLAAMQLGMSGIGFELSRNYKDSFLVKANLILNQ